MGTKDTGGAINFKELCRREWLVVDHHGYFAMGTASGARTRKYHSFLAGIAGRSERNFLAHVDITCFEQDLFTHAYKSPHDLEPVLHPQGLRYLKTFSTAPWPAWSWSLPQGDVEMKLCAVEAGGFEFQITFNNKNNLDTDGTLELLAPFTFRPLWAMRTLHSMGGNAVDMMPDGQSLVFRSLHETLQVSISADRPVLWQESPSLESSWFHHFYYEEENRRGYQSNEDLFSAGHLRFALPSGQTICLRIKAGNAATPSDIISSHAVTPASDFVLYNPAGIVAGFPWFGEWGRDTFISLPGIFATLIERNDTDHLAEWNKTLNWTIEILLRWSDWIDSNGMLPNVMTTDGPQWESSDATLWWSHALASLWTMAQAHPKLTCFALELKKQFGPRLNGALKAISSGRHAHLKLNSKNLLEVTTEHSTWMDARVDGIAATPRHGLLPEINALWIQAQCLQSLWTNTREDSWLKAAIELLALGLERERPNIVFLHSLPFAPSFLIQSFRGEPAASLLEDFLYIRNQFWTPVGLRTLAPYSKNYSPYYDGTPQLRDKIYHQGAAWGWLKGHFDMMATRLPSNIFSGTEQESTAYERSSVSGRFAELFEGEAPFTPRGIPAQAWSLACAEESRLRHRWSVDATTTRLLKEYQA